MTCKLVKITRNLGLNISLYADDAVIYCSNSDPLYVQSRLEEALSLVMNWCNRNYININIDKTKFCIRETRSNVDKFIPDRIVTETSEIDRCHQYLYLGIKLDEWLNMYQILITSLRSSLIRFTNLVKYETF